VTTDGREAAGESALEMEDVETATETDAVTVMADAVTVMAGETVIEDVAETLGPHDAATKTAGEEAAATVEDAANETVV